MTAIVDGLKEEHADTINIETVKVGDGDSKEQIRNAGLKVHGIVAKDSEGEIVSTVEGHSYGKEKVEEVIALLAKSE